jgi:hypothetical protein
MPRLKFKATKSRLSPLLFALPLAMAITGCSQQANLDGYIDKKGTLAIDCSKLTPKPVAFNDFSEDLAVVKYADGWGAINKQGEQVFKKPFRQLHNFHEGVAAFSEGKSDADQQWGYIDNKGNVTIKAQYAGANDFNQDVAAVMLSATPTKELTANGGVAGKWTYIDRTNKQQIAHSFDYADQFFDGVAVVTINTRMGAIDRSGNYVLKPEFDVVYRADHQKLVAGTGTGLSGRDATQDLKYYDIKGAVMSTAKFHGVSTLTNLKPMMWTDKPSPDGDPNRPLSKFVSPAFFCDKTIEQVGERFNILQHFRAKAFTGVYDYIFPVSEDFYVVYSDADGGKFDYHGGKPEDADGIWNNTAFRFYDAAPFSDGLGMVQEIKGGPYGYIDKSAHYALTPSYKQARSFHNGLALVGPSAALKP